MAFDTARLLEQIKIKGCLPTGRFEDAELLDFAYDVMLGEMVPMIIGVREEYYCKAASESITAGTSSIAIHTRAITGGLREVKMIDGDMVIDLERMDLEDLTNETTGTPEKFYMLGNDFVLVPTPSASTGSIRQYYFIRPSKFVTVAECAAISAIDTATNTVNVTIPTGWSTSNTFDLVKGRAHYDILSTDLAASSVAGGAITFTSSLPSTLRVGDYVCLAEESCFPYLPPEGHMALVQATAAAALEAIGDPRAEGVAAKAMMLKENFKSLLAVRVQGAPKRLATRVL